jgi:hypothetical protein
MARLSHDQLVELTLRRQFPSPSTTPGRELRDLFQRLGPIQSQVPRAPFLAAASRLPGTGYHTVCAAFESYQLVKTTNLRGTVHTSTAAQFPALDAIARQTRAAMITKMLGLTVVRPEELEAELEAFCHDAWRPRDELCAHVERWLADREPGFAGLNDTGTRGLAWGHSGLIRRPKDAAWDKRTDVFHRAAAALLNDHDRPDPDQALADSILHHCAAYGPMHRTDLAFFFGVGLTKIDAAVASLGDQLVRHTGPDREQLVDCAEPPPGGNPDPHYRLLGEFDGLLLGFHGHRRNRFCTEEQLAVIWRKINGLFSPVVLHDQRLIATWRTIARGRRTEVEITMLPGERTPPEDIFADTVAEVATALNLEILAIKVLPFS